MMKLSIPPLILVAASCASEPVPVTPESRTERQMLGLLEKFDRWDDNGNGELTVKEVDQGILRFKDTPMRVNYTGRQVVDFYDSDRSGTVSLREVQEGYHRADEAKARFGE